MNARPTDVRTACLLLCQNGCEDAEEAADRPNHDALCAAAAALETGEHRAVDDPRPFLRAALDLLDVADADSDKHRLTREYARRAHRYARLALQHAIDDHAEAAVRAAKRAT